MNKKEQENRANQLNPAHDAYWQSRGGEERPQDWEEPQASKDSPEPTKPK